VSITLKRYPEYRDSGTDWIGRIPAHWNCLPNRAIFQERIDKNHPDEPLLSVTIGQGVVPQREFLKDSSKRDSSNQDKRNYKLVLPNDIAYNKMRAWQGALGASQIRGIVSPAYVVVSFRKERDNPTYFHYLMRTPTYAKEAERWSYGISSDQWSLRSEDFKRIYVPAPPGDEQNHIGHFLKWMHHQIHQLIRSKRREIELLNAQKQAVIDSELAAQNVRNGWECTRLKYVAAVHTGVTLGKRYRDTPLFAYPYLRVANVQNGFLDLGTIKTVEVPEAEARACTLQPGDVLMTEGGDIDKLGRGSVWRGEIPNCLHQNHVFAVRTAQERLNSDFLVLLMTSRYGRTYFQSTAKKTTNLASTNQTTIRNFPLLLPPIDQQAELVRSVSLRSSDLEMAIRRAAREIELIREHRTRLIIDVVMGKLDVRGNKVPQIDLEQAAENSGSDETGEVEMLEEEETVPAEEGDDAAD